MPNFGDALNPIICKKIFNIDVEYSDPTRCEASFIGSLLDDFLYPDRFEFPFLFLKKKLSPTVKIWGTGFILDKNKFIQRPKNLPETYFRNVEIYAVRGLFSKARLEKILNKSLDDVCIGDPGLLANELIENNNIEKKYDLGIIPHHLEIKMPIFKTMQKNIPNSIIINMEADPMESIKLISQCKAILSSAMHGLIVSDSFGIPNMRMLASDKLIGGDYKFNDYYSVYGLDDHFKFDIREKDFVEKNIALIYENYKISQNKVLSIKQNLKTVFPYNNI